MLFFEFMVCMTFVDVCFHKRPGADGIANKTYHPCVPFSWPIGELMDVFVYDQLILQSAP